MDQLISNYIVLFTIPTVITSCLHVLYIKDSNIVINALLSAIVVMLHGFLWTYQPIHGYIKYLTIPLKYVSMVVLVYVIGKPIIVPIKYANDESSFGQIVTTVNVFTILDMFFLHTISVIEFYTSYRRTKVDKLVEMCDV